MTDRTEGLRQIERQQDRTALMGCVLTRIALEPEGSTAAALREAVISETGFSELSVSLVMRIARSSGFIVRNGNRGGFKLTDRGAEYYTQSYAEAEID